MEAEIKDCITQAENCILLLLPHPESFQLHGLKSPDPQRAEHEKQHPLAAVTSSALGQDSNTVVDAAIVKSEDCSSQAGVGASESASADSAEATDPRTCALEVPEQSRIKLEKDCSEFSAVHRGLDGSGAGPMVTSVGFTSSLVNCREPAECQNSTALGPETTEQDWGQEEEQEEGNSSDDFEELSDKTDDESDAADDLVRHHGLGSQKYSLTIDLPPDGIHFKETPDNTDILHALKDVVQLISNKFPALTAELVGGGSEIRQGTPHGIFLHQELMPEVILPFSPTFPLCQILRAWY